MDIFKGSKDGGIKLPHAILPIHTWDVRYVGCLYICMALFKTCYFKFLISGMMKVPPHSNYYKRCMPGFILSNILFTLTVFFFFHAKLIFWVLSFGSHICLIAWLTDWWIAQSTATVIIRQGRSSECPKEPVEMDGFGDFILLPPESISSSLMAACTLWQKSQPTSCHTFWTVHLQKPR